MMHKKEVFLEMRLIQIHILCPSKMKNATIKGRLVYLIYKQNNLTCFRCEAIQSKDNIDCNG